MRPRGGTGRCSVDEVLAAWPAAAPGGPLGPDTALHPGARELVGALLGRRDPAATLYELGRRAGTEGWPLEKLSEWLVELAAVPGCPGDDLTRSDATLALATGWAGGFLDGAERQTCVDAATGLATPGVLRYRLEQVHAQCRALEVDPGLVYALVVVDAGLSRLAALRREAARIVVADEVIRFFDQGETAAALGDRVVVLVPRNPDLQDRLTALSISLHQHHEVRDAGVLVWVEGLPASADLIDRLLDDPTP